MTKQLRQRLTAIEARQSQKQNTGIVLCQYDDDGVLIERGTGKPIADDDTRKKLVIHTVRANQTPRDSLTYKGSFE